MFDQQLHLGLAAALSTSGTMHLLGACCFLAWLVENFALGLLGGAGNLVFDRDLCLGRSFLCDASCSSLGGGGLFWSTLLASDLAPGFGGDGVENARLGVTGGGASGGHDDERDRLVWR